MKCAIAVFAKTIGMSPVKTRLSAGIGQDNAETFYRLSVACIEAVLKSVVSENKSVFPNWALAEEGGPLRAEWNSFPAIWTGEGGLGDRLSRVSQELLRGHDAVILIGTDSPQMTPKTLLKMVEILQSNSPNKHLAGPATDGGFWLWGMRKNLPPEVWQGVTYSTDTTLDELIGAAEDHGHSVVLCGEMQDVDLLDDLKTLQESLEHQGSRLLDAQVELLSWLQDHNPTFRV